MSHIKSIGTGDWPLYSRLWTPGDVLLASSQGARFYIQPPGSLNIVNLDCVICPSCSEAYALATTSGVVRHFDVFEIPNCR